MTVSDRWMQGVGWCIIAVIVALALLRSLASGGLPRPAPSLNGTIAQVRLAVGLYHLLGQQAGATTDLPSGGGSRERAMIAVGTGEIRGGAQALADLEGISDDDPRVRADLDLLKACYTGGPVEPTEVKRAWGWIGDLATVQALPSGDPRRVAALRPALRAALASVCGLLLAAGALVAGLILASWAWTLWRGGGLAPAGRAPDGDSSCLLAFAIYLVAFTGFGVLVHLLMDEPPLSATWLFLPLAVGVLLVPVLRRGWTWPDLRQALGLHAGKGVAAEMGAGLVGYLTGLPLVVIGLIATMQLTRWFPADHPVTHDIVSNAGTVTGALAILALASVFAPLVEETMFRGLLLHHLRRHGNAIAVLGSALIFAIIHPQGIAGIPALTAIAVVFALIRIRRGSLIASMTAHALHNGALVVAMVLVMG